MRTAMASPEIVAPPAHPESLAEPARAATAPKPSGGSTRMRKSPARMLSPMHGAPEADGAPAGAPVDLAAALAAERHVTLELQRAILPLHEGPFDLPGLRAVVRYLPASHDSRVGGDWYITAEMPGGHVLLALGDVGGHGLAAAAGMARLRGALAGLAITGSPPERLVGWLNDLVHHVGPEHTASVVAGYYDPPSRVLTWAQAGHPPPVLVRGREATALRSPAGILLGAARSGYDAASLELRKGDLILLYSDGLIERRHRSLDEGLAALTSAAAGITDPENVISVVLDTLGSTDTEDDTCLVALYVR